MLMYFSDLPHRHSLHCQDGYPSNPHNEPISICHPISSNHSVSSKLCLAPLVADAILVARPGCCLAQAVLSASRAPETILKRSTDVPFIP